MNKHLGFAWRPLIGAIESMNWKQGYPDHSAKTIRERVDTSAGVLPTGRDKHWKHSEFWEFWHELRYPPKTRILW